jgi:hypothetical protein
MAAQAAEAVGLTPGTSSFAELSDRWIWTFMAALFFVTVLLGFVPDSISMLAAVDAGARPALPPVLHFHAVMMGIWISLLLAQSLLMAAGHRNHHMKLGLAAVVVAPLVVISMVAVVISNFAFLASSGPEFLSAEALGARKFAASNLLLEQIRLVFVFAVLVTWAMLVRRQAPETHKRLIFFATLMPLPAAFNRIPWLPSTLPDSPTSNLLLMLLWLSPLLIYDIWRRGRIHHAYVTGIALLLPFIVFAYSVWGSDWWIATAPRIFGIEHWADAGPVH